MGKHRINSKKLNRKKDCEEVYDEAYFRKLNQNRYKHKKPDEAARRNRLIDKKMLILKALAAGFSVFAALGIGIIQSGRFGQKEGAYGQGRKAEIVEDPSGTLEVDVIDVGQADCILVIQDEYTLLIDAGNNNDGPELVHFLQEKNVEKLDIVIATHPHEDHIGAMDDIIYNFDIEMFIMTDARADTKSYTDVADALHENQIDITTPVVGDEYNLGDAYFTIISPAHDYGEDLNNGSVGIKLVFGQNSFVFTGDAGEEAEQEMCESGLDLRADVLKSGHHGSAYSTTEEMLEAVRPEYAVISVGADNDYGHPADEVLERLNRFGVEIYRTDLKGTIIFLSDGKNIRVITEK